MTKDEALKLALEALETPWNAPYVNGCDLALGKKVKAITAIKEALMSVSDGAQTEQPPYHHFVSDRFNIDPQTGNLNIGAVKKQEPVAWRAKNFYENQEGWFYAEWHQDGLTPQVAELLYTTTPQRKPLTDEEIAETLTGYRLSDAIDITRAIEAAHGIKG